MVGRITPMSSALASENAATANGLVPDKVYFKLF